MTGSGSSFFPSLELQYQDPDYLASVAFARVVYNKSPYGLPGEGTPETVQKLDRDQLAKFHDCELRAESIAACDYRGHNARTSFRHRRKIFRRVAESCEHARRRLLRR